MLVVLVAVTTIAGCSTEAARMAKCEVQANDKSFCYVAEQNRKATMNAVAEAQALQNAHNAVQHAQAVHNHLPKGCAQVQDAKAECDVKSAKANGSYKQLTIEANHVMNNTISDAAKHLFSKGWKPENGEWHKSGYVLRLVLENEVVMNGQLTK